MAEDEAKYDVFVAASLKSDGPGIIKNLEDAGVRVNPRVGSRLMESDAHGIAETVSVMLQTLETGAVQAIGAGMWVAAVRLSRPLIGRIINALRKRDSENMGPRAQLTLSFSAKKPAERRIYEMPGCDRAEALLDVYEDLERSLSGHPIDQTRFWINGRWMTHEEYQEGRKHARASISKQGRTALRAAIASRKLLVYDCLHCEGVLVDVDGLGPREIEEQLRMIRMAQPDAVCGLTDPRSSIHVAG